MYVISGMTNWYRKASYGTHPGENVSPALSIPQLHIVLCLGMGPYEIFVFHVIMSTDAVFWGGCV